MSAPACASDRTCAARSTVKKRTKVRYAILLMLFLVTAINVGDRAALFITGAAITAQLHISSVTLGYMFSAFGVGIRPWAIAGWIAPRSFWLSEGLTSHISRRFCGL